MPIGCCSGADPAQMWRMSELPRPPAIPPESPPQPPAPAPVRPAMPKEIGGPSGPEPTRYGDWEHKGRCSDF
jgi:hypothetical protein